MPDDLALVEAGTRCFLEALAAGSDEPTSSPTSLPGWTVGHVATHVARNADALTNLIRWAATGTPTPMYASEAVRTTAIEHGASRSRDQLLADVEATARRFADEAAALPDDRWEAKVVTARGREVEAAEVLWMRAREVWVHASDLDSERVAAWPTAFARRLLDEACRLLESRLPPGQPAIVLSDENGEVAVIGSIDTEPPVGVKGNLNELAAWVTGRRASHAPTPVAPLDTLPVLPTWI